MLTSNTNFRFSIVISVSFLQLQGIKWIKTKYGEKLRVIRLGQKGYLDIIENCISNGFVVLIESIEESVDPVLDNLLGRTLIKRGT